MREVIIFVALAFPLAFAGCSCKEDKVVGTWKITKYENTKKPDEKLTDCDMALEFIFSEEASERKLGSAEAKKLIIKKGKKPCDIKPCMGEPYESRWMVAGGKLQVGSVCLTVNNFSGVLDFVELGDKKMVLNFFDRLKLTFERVK